MITLVPYHPRHAERILHWQCDPVYARIWRGVDRYLTLAECEQLPLVLGCEVLLVMRPEGPVGMVTLEVRDGVGQFDVLIDQAEQRQGYGTAALATACAYAMHRRHLRMLRADIVANDHTCAEALTTVGFHRIGVVPRLASVNGEWCDIALYYKELSSWGS